MYIHVFITIETAIGEQRGKGFGLLRSIKQIKTKLV